MAKHNKKIIIAVIAGIAIIGVAGVAAYVLTDKKRKLASWGLTEGTEVGYQARNDIAKRIASYALGYDLPRGWSAATSDCAKKCISKQPAFQQWRYLADEGKDAQWSAAVGCLPAADATLAANDPTTPGFGDYTCIFNIIKAAESFRKPCSCLKN